MSGVKDLLNALADPQPHKSQRRAKRALPVGVTYHAINESRTFGNANALAGSLLVEDETGHFHRVTGEELSEFYDAYPDFIKNWKIEID